METCFTLSTISTSSIEEVASACPSCLHFFQLYIYRDRDVTRQLIARAEQAGFAALVLTVDTPFFGKRRADNRNKFKLPPHLKSAFMLLIFPIFHINSIKVVDHGTCMSLKQLFSWNFWVKRYDSVIYCMC